MSLLSRIRWNDVHSTASVLLALWRGAKPVGTDEYGNRYYVGKARRGYHRERRFVMYEGEPEATRVPPEWHAWLHHQTERVPQQDNPLRRSWMKAHRPNPTGTDEAYRPPGHTLVDRPRAASASGDYEAWTPD